MFVHRSHGFSANAECEEGDWHEDDGISGGTVVLIIIIAVGVVLLGVAIGVCVCCKVCKKAAPPAQGLPTAMPMATVVEAKPVETGGNQQNQTFSGSL